MGPKILWWLGFWKFPKPRVVSIKISIIFQIDKATAPSGISSECWCPVINSDYCTLLNTHSLFSNIFVIVRVLEDILSVATIILKIDEDTTIIWGHACSGGVYAFTTNFLYEYKLRARKKISQYFYYGFKRINAVVLTVPREEYSIENTSFMFLTIKINKCLNPHKTL